MRIEYLNKENINNIYIHDTFVEEFLYDNRKEIIYLSFSDNFVNKKYNFEFKNVIYTEIQNCEFYSKGWYQVLGIELLDENAVIKGIKTKYNKKNVDFEKISKLNEYIAIRILFDSGNEIIILSELIIYEETDLK